MPPPQTSRFGPAPVLKRWCWESSHLRTDPRIRARFSSTNEQLARLSLRLGSVHVLIGWICAARLLLTRSPRSSSPDARSGVPAGRHSPTRTDVRPRQVEDPLRWRLDIFHFPFLSFSLLTAASVRPLGLEYSRMEHQNTTRGDRAVSDKMGILHFRCV